MGDATALFSASAMPTFTTFSEFGLVLYLFLVGLELPEVVLRVGQSETGTLLLTVAVVLLCIIGARMVKQPGADL